MLGIQDVTEAAGKPGCYIATVFLKPHFQLEELTASLRLVAELPPLTRRALEQVVSFHSPGAPGIIEQECERLLTLLG